jgi:hypothetical protein
MTMKKLLGVLFCFPLIAWAIIRIVAGVHFDINCGDHMERAGLANSIDLAQQEMEIIVKYAENNGMTSGYTSVFWNSPGDDVGFWYNNMKSSLEELRQVKPGATSLEKSNVLIKLRESVVYHTKESINTTAPDGISVFPHNIGYTCLLFSSLLAAVVGVLLFVSEMDW